jgi:hypothetical protein
MSGDEGFSPDQEPMFFSLLDEADKQNYLEMRAALHASEKRFKRNKRVESLQDAITDIREFCVRHRPDDWKRFLVCGFCPMGQDIAINTRQFRLLVDKCKSSINGALLKMGYGTAPVKSAISASLLSYIPFLKGNFIEQRQWTVRRKIQLSPMPMRPGYPIPFVIPLRAAQTMTPEPALANQGFLEFPSQIDDLSVFGFPELGKTEPELAKDGLGYDFITDPCSCCPMHWAKKEEKIDEFFTFA